MKELKALKRTAIAGVAMAALFTSLAAGAAELKLAHFMSPKHPFHGVFEAMGEELSKATNGDVTIRVFPGGQLGANPTEQFNRAVDGVADIAFAIPGYTAALFPRMVVAEYPGLAAEPKDMTRRLNAAFAKGLFKNEFARVKILALWNIPPGVIYTTKKPVRSLADMNGMKMRVASASVGELVKAWGGSPVFMPVTEVYNAMQTGAVDGTMIDPGAALAFRLNEVAKYMTVGFNSFLTNFFLAMNKDSWEGLSPAAKKALDGMSGNPLGERLYDSWLGLSNAGAKSMKAKGKEVLTLSAAEAAKFNALSEQVREKAVAEMEGRGVNAKELAAALKD
jgi:TRAP-type C4-dicarboxylate transport system substrate-binding protein